MKSRNHRAAAQSAVGFWMLALGVLALGAALLAMPKAHAATFTFTNPNCSSFVVSGTPPSQTITCGSSAAGVPVCTPTANPTSANIGSSVVVSANCTNNPTSFTWSGGGCGANGATTTCTVTKTRATTITFTVTGINGAGIGLPAQVSVTWK